MRFVACLLGCMAFFAAGPASALEVQPRLMARGWFFDAQGTVEGENVEDFGFDEKKGQPEVRGNLGIGRHDLEFSFLLIDREEREFVPVGGPLGVSGIQAELFMDLEVEDVRGHYGYSLFRNRWLDFKPFIAVAYVSEEADIRNEASAQTRRSDEEAVFPLPGVDLVLFKGFPVRAKARASGIGFGGDHIIDVEGGLETVFWKLVGGFGFRHVSLKFDDRFGEQASTDIDLNGFYVEGGIRF